jgi:hypothetical protein
MSTDPNQPSQLSKSASSAQSRTKGQTNAAPEPSSPAEPMTDQPSKSTLATPPTRIPASESAGSTNPPVPEPVISTSSTAVPKSGTQPSPDLPLTEASAEPSLDSTPSESAVSEPASSEPASSEPVLSESTSAEPAVAESVSSESAEPQPAQAAAVDPVEPAASTSAPATDAPLASSTADSAEPDASAAQPDPSTAKPSALSRNQPIPPASEPMQYRAIGLVRGKYLPSEEQFTRGSIVTDDEVIIDAVLLGRVMSLVKKHIDLAESHLWVVYPRTREKNLELHMQIVGVWEPDKLNRMGGEETTFSAEDLSEEAEGDEAEGEETEAGTAEIAEVEATEAAPESAEAEAEPTAESAGSASLEADGSISEEDLDDCYFSVRGEVVFQSEEEQRLLVKIRRAPKPGETEGKAFKVALKGILDGKALGYFWDMQVRREGSDLTVQEATQIGLVPPQKRKPGGGRRGPGGRPPRRGAGGPPPRRNGQQAGPPRRRWDNREGGREPGREGVRENRPYRSDRPATPAPTAPRPPVAKPVKRQKEEPSA